MTLLRAIISGLESIILAKPGGLPVVRPAARSIWQASERIHFIISALSGIKRKSRSIWPHIGIGVGTREHISKSSAIPTAMRSSCLSTANLSVGYRDGEAVAEATVATTGAPSKLVVSADATVLRIAGISQIELSTQDKNGAYVPDAACLVHCRIDGPAHLVGMDGGDLSDLSLWAAPQRKMFAGLLLAVIQADAPGDVTVTFSAEGMPDEIVHLKVE